MTPTTMKAIRLHAFGGPRALRYEEAPVPVPAPGEVLVRVRAAGLNPPDWYVREGMPGVPDAFKPSFDLPLIPGTDVSGVVAAVADDVRTFAPGDEVMGLLRFPDPMQSGAYAEYVTAPAGDLALKPAGVDHVHAAALPMSGLTAWQYLIDVGHDRPSPFQEARHRPVRLDDTTTVLVNGAGGGVGHLALQLAAWKGARTIAVASGAHERFLRELGADAYIDYTRERPEDVVRDVDVVLDAVGGPTSRRFLPALKRGGSLFPVYVGEFDEEENARFGVTVTGTQVRANGAQLAELAALVDAGTVRVAVDSVHPLAQARAAHERAAEGHLQGKIVLTVD
ncbi:MULTISPECIES: NADP-dependent oxidoreductase [Streptomyces]|nr:MULTISPECIES: NADP-dependent oxidoreductase [Streptomyces]MBD3554109.1 NADP-dependent oxidoreductase [Streptomyces sp. SP18CM02]QRV29400.1 NADP-dependent oxidoreductase [Streptomyces californicus]QRV34994.1 NADP-dependent oxidoreductase [Streptomyces californicus]QRV42813.1 NADP-dependent oxidoreductase [Streptomyces californicus]QRV49500.1 NADP-dependent oxidoreductase [Streptomyces californicus]